MSHPVPPAADPRVEIHLDAPSSSRTGPPAPTGVPFSAHLEGTHPAEGQAPAWAEALREGGRSVARGERLLERAVRAGRRGAELGHAELLALQAGVYRYTQELELASKLIDKATGAVRQTMQSQR